MGLNIKDEAIVEKARKLAARMDNTMTGVIRQALDLLERHVEAENEALIRRRLERMDKAEARLPAFANDLTSDHSTFYGDDGMPA